MKHRMTAQSKVNIAAACRAVIEKTEGGFRVKLIGKSGKFSWVENSGGVTEYATMYAASLAIKSKNSTIPVGLAPEI